MQRDAGGWVDLDELVSLESALAEMEKRTAVAAASAKKLLSVLTASTRASAVGDLSAMHKALDGARDALRLSQTDFGNAINAWPYDEAVEQIYFETTYAQELKEAAGEQGLTISEDDHLLMCYPSVIRVEAQKRAVSIDKKPYKSVRPSVLASHLRLQQTKSIRFRPGPFLEALYSAWDYARRADTRGMTLALDVPVDRIYAVLTVAPGAAKEYSRQEFGRDLLLLLDSAEQCTKKGAVIHISSATGSKNKKGVITVVKKDGTPVLFSSLSFTEAARHGS
ncbi:MAG: hypothetical protein MUQ56_00310 [Thermoleophilia bacterium]|jgi:hypothetical protein|nr:hypothetical protein [Thermoleophilia bacterium]